MNRAIEFRGLTKKGVWIYGMPTHDFKHIFNGENTDSPDNYEVIPETVGQFTGLFDKNGTKIFEGDLLNIDPFLTPHEVVFGCSTKWTCSFNLKTNSSIIYLNETMGYDSVIIGNIFDNNVAKVK